ncbi:MAG: RNA pyrophosphohydrolase [Alphaproteobacteria bacterium]|nr:RNA pyrophosphohydrolase [Alphaproteobacteria bacterium]MBF0128596.1 RNA pyrophosphohydrolase [Alphaproteobacteria bacterium]
MGSLPYRHGVGVLLVNRDGLVFVGRRIDTPEPAWQLPQGGIDDGETPEEAAVRELREETGVTRAAIVAGTEEWLTYDLPPALVGKVWGGRYRGQRQKWFVMRFDGTDADVRIDGPHPEFSAWKWAEVDRLPGLVVPFKRDLYLRIVAALRDAVGTAHGA